MKTFKELYEACCAACEKRTEMEESDSGLAAKAEKSGMPLSTLRKVYKRGVAAWNSGHRPGTTPQQWGMARVNSYITKGKGTYHGADKDLREEEVEQIDEGVIDSIKRATGFAMPSKHGDTVRGSVVANYLEDDTPHGTKTLEKVRKTKYKLHHIDLETAKRHRNLTNKIVGIGGRDIIDPDKMNRMRGTKVTYDSLVKHPPVMHHDGTILDGNHRIQRAIDLGHSKIPVLAPHDWKPRGVNKEVEVNEEIHAPGTKVNIPHKGKSVTGKVVRYDKGAGGYSPAYVVHVSGEYESPIVPAHKVKKVHEEVELDEVSKVSSFIRKVKQRGIRHAVDPKGAAFQRAVDKADAIHQHKNLDVTDPERKKKLAKRVGKMLDVAGSIHARGKVKEEVELDEVAKDKESGLPKKYVSGLSPSTAKARAAHWKEKAKLSDKDPAAYEPAPGDATAKTRESKHTIKARKMFGEACWTGYKKVGMKKKGDKMVPNCVPANEEVEQIDEISRKKAREYGDAAHEQESDIRHTLKSTEKSKHLSPSTRDELKKLADRRKAGIKLAADKRGYYKGSDAKANFTHGDAKVPATEETQKGKNVVPPTAATIGSIGGLVREEENDNKPLGKVMRAGDGKKKFKVFVKNSKGNVVKVGFGDPNMEIKRDDPERRKNFRARHNCDTATDRTTPRYWSCRQWRASSKVEA